MEHMVRRFNTLTPLIDIFRFIVISEVVSGQFKEKEDKESTKADWFSLNTIKNLLLRASDVLDIIHTYLQGKKSVPLHDIYKTDYNS